MHSELKVLTLDQRRALNRAVQCYKEATIADSGLHYMFVNAEQNRPTRHAKNVEVPRIDSELGRKSFAFRGPVFWNELDSELKNKENKLYLLIWNNTSQQFDSKVPPSGGRKKLIPQ